MKTLNQFLTEGASPLDDILATMNLRRQLVSSPPAGNPLGDLLIELKAKKLKVVDVNWQDGSNTFLVTIAWPSELKGKPPTSGLMDDFYSELRKKLGNDGYKFLGLAVIGEEAHTPDLQLAFDFSKQSKVEVETKSGKTETILDRISAFFKRVKK